MQTSHRSTPFIVGSLAIAAIVGASTYVMRTSTRSSASTTSTTSQVASPSATSTATPTSQATEASPNAGTSSAATGQYNNGTYSTSVTYAVPKGERNTIKVTLTLKDGAITDVSTTHAYNDRESGAYIDSFDAQIKSAIVDTLLTEAYAGRVGSASLTSNAFNQALQQIQHDAKQA